ncbi:hypothetical protein LAh9_51 [Aeromonas phage LAh_9]|uniref:Uncharacterized protein n=4 Tax=Lahexavirus TaxID=2843411 RepID=A0A514A132_9CAUD|nr:hypothetical protein HWC29_gp058 [Aeromonas phage 4_4572]YP_009847292.1 hypothetical protein HWC30_gp118 [Aeromonas phage LAh_6]YP_009847348.1 hypothetical protein HWC31_gp010 [Aeromonas phage LAh_8]YP_009847532.1 hypothetical protein HWC32_gp051 [Aeromonas phage LAh_9]QDH46618.1 hypothetical protein LAh6_118 [Aeromonas phage LAh_6]QDH46850.1 hypothetical protein LAh8_10 [Aeromonas phage LAh_8]QDH46988.1 hypothetical protein LAh9_51 [Aeromonas phage LAh_9]QEG09128.1 hypothetical protein [
MGKLVIDFIVLGAGFGLGYWFAVSNYFSNEVKSKTVRVGDRFFKVTKVEMTEKEAE